MISHISIEDFATIENIEVDFHKGLNIITGETGSGKSIFLTALSLVLGSRADSSMIRTGASRALVQMIAEYQHKDIIISREISSEGRNLCKIDGEIVTLAQLSEICSQLADIHGQYDTQYLLNPENHIKLVDRYEKSSIVPTVRRVAELCDEFKDASEKLARLQEEAQDNDKKRKELEWQIADIEKANLSVGEDTKLQEAIEVLKNKDKIYNGLGKAYELANGDGPNALTGMDAVIESLKDISTISKEASELGDEFSDLYYRFEDVANRLRETRDKMIYDYGEIDIFMDRLDFIESMKRKYNGTIDEILELKDTLETQLYRLGSLETDVEAANLEKMRVKEMLDSETERLTSLRKSSASTLQGKIEEELENLNFNDVTIAINVEALDRYTHNGMDKIEFLISTNKGEPMKPLAKIASGGELSRIMLAFKKVIGEYDGIPTMIFDEIDSGISGETANIVGKALSSLGETHQVITITHLPQIAACGDHNYRIEKSSDSDSTYTTMLHLSSEEKIAEVARLMAGMNISDITIQTAKEMIGFK